MKTYNSLQEVYDTAVAGLASQNFQLSLLGSGSLCAYRSPNGCKCAIGWCIPDELYSPDMEGTMIAGLLAGTRKRFSLGYLFPSSCDEDSLQRLQRCHDRAHGIDKHNVRERMRQNLIDFGREHNLQVPEVLLTV